MDVLEFLHSQLYLVYSVLNTAMSALSGAISIDNVPVGEHLLPLVHLKVPLIENRHPESPMPFGM